MDLSTDGGKTWRNIWEDFRWSLLYGIQQHQVVLPLPQAAGKSQVQIRFRAVNYSAFSNFGWELDNMFLGNRSCEPTISGGLVVGTVADANTGQGIAGADITSIGTPQESATTAQIPGDPAAGGGSYWMFSPLTGSQQFQATAYNYGPQKATTSVAANAAARLDFSLTAGQLTATPGSLSATQQLGASTTEKLTLTNTSKTPVALRLDGQPGNFTLAGQRPAARAASTASGWASLPNLPKSVSDTLVVADPSTGDVYSFGNEPSCCRSDAFVYHPGATSWAALPDMPGAIAWPAGGFVNGKIYITGGYNGSGPPPVWVYDPVTRQWSIGARRPTQSGNYGNASAVLNGKIYVLSGGEDVDVYDPATDTWSAAASYPRSQVSWQACGGFNGEIYCAGGIYQSGLPVTSAYAYDPTTNSWSAIPSLPIPLGGSDYAAANGQLLVAGGLGRKDLHEQGLQLHPRQGLDDPSPPAEDNVARWRRLRPCWVLCRRRQTGIGEERPRYCAVTATAAVARQCRGCP